MATHLQQIAKTNVHSRSTAEAGNGLFATRQIELNNTILSVAQPLMVALDTPRLKDTCYHCFLFIEKSGSIKRNDNTKTKTLKACTGCTVVRYCDKVSKETGTQSSSVTARGCTLGPFLTAAGGLMHCLFRLPLYPSTFEASHAFLRLDRTDLVYRSARRVLGTTIIGLNAGYLTNFPRKFFQTMCAPLSVCYYCKERNVYQMANGSS